jgi:hypothetical protein
MEQGALDAKMTYRRTIILAALLTFVVLGVWRWKSASPPVISEPLTKTDLITRCSVSPFFVSFTNAIAGNDFSDSNIRNLQNLVIQASVAGGTNDIAFHWAMSQTELTNLHNANIPVGVRHRLFATALNALGFSGREEALRRYQELTNISSEIAPFSGGVVQGVFNLDTIKKYGRDKALNEVLHSPDSSYDEFLKWRMSSNAGPWVLWSARMCAPSN